MGGLAVDERRETRNVCSPTHVRYDPRTKSDRQDRAPFLNRPPREFTQTSYILI